MRLFWRSTLIFLALAFLTIGWLVTLPWFIWYLQPPGERQAVVSSEAKKTSIARIIEQSQGTPPLIGLKDQTGALKRNLRGDTAARWFVALGATIKAVAFDNAPLRPLAILTVPANTLGASNGKQPMNVALARDEHDLLISGTVGTERVWLTPPTIPEFSVSHQLEIIAPGYVVGLLPPPVARQWNNLLTTSFGLTNTQPDIVGFISQFEFVQLRLGEAQPFLAVKGAPDAFRGAIEEWLQEEERHHRLTDNYFALPDGTLGREKIPGNARTLLGANNQNCQQTDSTELPFWFCQSDEAAALTTSRIELVELFPNQMTGWEIHLAESILTAPCSDQAESPLCGFREMFAVGDDTSFQARLVGEVK